MGEDNKPKKVYITCDGLEVDISELVGNIPKICLEPPLVEDHTMLAEKLAQKKRDYNRLFDKHMATMKRLEIAEKERYTARDDCRIALDWLCYHVTRPPRWRVFAYLAWKRSTPKQVAAQYKRADDYEHVRQCSEKEIRRIFLRYGYPETLFEK